MEIQSVKVATRQDGGKKAARKLRAAGALPGVLYGGGKEAVNLTINRHDFETIIHHSRGGEHAILRLEVEDQPELSTPVLLKEIQHHPLRGDYLHADFLRIRLDEQIETAVSIRIEGQAPGVAEGGILDHQMREVEIQCRALDVPDEFVVDVSELHIGDSVHLGEVALPEGVILVTESERPVVTVLAPRIVKEAEEEEAVEAEEGAEEPERVGEKEEEE